jgi:precorrin-6B C5,15-methyltransferase / cobalt-precorrin-6B C5,C15-methyltransferase
MQELMQKWLSVVGVGEDGLAGLSPIARALVSQASVIVGGERHLAMLPADLQERIVWSTPIATSLEQIKQRRGQSVCVLASGDPMCYGIGVSLLRQTPITEMTIIPAPSAFSLACARLGWALMEVETLSLCGRDPDLLHVALYPGARLLILSADSSTPAVVAERLTRAGFGQSQITVLERMGGPQERLTEGTAANWNTPTLSDLNTVAVACVSDPQTPTLSRLAGLPDAAYHHDGQLTKQEVRAMTLAALAPQPGQLLWDVGAGCGSIAIEWMRSHPRCRAIAIERESTRLQLMANNAAALGTPNLQIIPTSAPEALQNLPTPDAVFVGGGLTTDALFLTCWNALRPGGRFVTNAVTVESEQKLLEWRSQFGGKLTRIAIQRAEPVGSFLGWKAMAPVTQWVSIKA